MWVNGQLVQDLSQPPAPTDDHDNTCEADLHAGWNELLVKVQAGDKGLRFHIGISSPGDLHFSRQAQ